MESVNDGATTPPGVARVSRRTMLGLVLSASGAALLAACTPQASAPAPTSAPAKPAESKPADAAKPTGAAKPTEAAKPAAPAATTAPAAAAKPADAAKPAAASVSTPSGVVTNPAFNANPQAGKTGGILRWGQVGDIPTTDAIYWSPATDETTGQVCDTLVTYDDQLNPIPRLAESWELSTDQKRVKLNLRKGVQFHSGREFVADDVEYNMIRARDPKNGFAAVVASGSNWWTSIEKPDKHTIILSSEQPRPGVWDWLNYMRIQDKDVRDGPDAATKVGGTGSMKWEEWVPGDHITMSKNKNYWESGHPFLDGYEVKIFRDQQAMVSSLEAGAIDVAALIPIPDAVRLKDNPQFQVFETHDVGQFFYAAVNTGMAPTDNKLLRHAIGHAIDRQRFAEGIMKGFVGEPKALMWPPTSPAYEPQKNNHYTYDLDKAKSLLAQSGLSNVEFDIAWSLAGFQAEYAALAQVIQSDLAKIGIKTNLKPTDPAAFVQAGLGKNPQYNGMRLSAGAFSQMYEAGSLFALSRTMGYLGNQSGFYDPEYEKMVLSAASEPDAAKRKQIYSKINDFLLDAAYLFTVTAYSNIMAMGKNVRGLRFEPTTSVTIRDMWLA